MRERERLDRKDKERDWIRKTNRERERLGEKDKERERKTHSEKDLERQTREREREREREGEREKRGGGGERERIEPIIFRTYMFFVRTPIYPISVWSTYYFHVPYRHLMKTWQVPFLHVEKYLEAFINHEALH